MAAIVRRRVARALVADAVAVRNAADVDKRHNRCDVTLDDERRAQRAADAERSSQLRYHHLGIPTTDKLEDEVHVAHLRVFVSGYGKSPYGVEWMRYEDDAPYPTLVKTVPHVAFEVEDVAEAIRGKNVIIEPNSPGPGVLVAFIEDNGAPIEFLQIDHHVAGGGA
jgi:hypothetical protein